jgi:capsular exopolysaccharide synthesis family protein
MEINELIKPLLRWWWLIIIATIIAAASSYVATMQQPPVFRSRATLMIGRTIDNPNPTSVQFNLEEQLAASYANIANREPLREATKEALGINWLPEYSVSAVPNTQLIEIVVVDTDPYRAQTVAQEIANQLILRSPTSENQEDLSRQAFINEQLDILQKQITDTQQEIEDLTFQLSGLNSAREISDTQDQISSLQRELSSLQSNYANLLSETDQGAINTLTIIEYPNLPTRPIGSQQFITVGLAGAVGFTMAAAAAYLLEYLDKTIKSVDEVKKLIPAPILGYIPEIPKKENKWLFVTDNPRSPIADAFRNLRTNIELADPELKTILVTASAISIGKSTIALNYAQILTQANKRVILVDGDLRKSVLNEALDFPKDLGLSKILQGKRNLKEISFPLKKGFGLVIPSGPPPPNPTELLGSEMMTQTLSSLKKMSEMVVIDGPPIFVTDATVLANQVDGILLVVQIGKTRKDIIREMMEQIKRTDIRIIGVVVNKVNKRSNYYSSYYGNYYDIPEPEIDMTEEDIESEEEIDENPEEEESPGKDNENDEEDEENLNEKHETDEEDHQEENKD